METILTYAFTWEDQFRPWVEGGIKFLELSEKRVVCFSELPKASVEMMQNNCPRTKIAKCKRNYKSRDEIIAHINSNIHFPVSSVVIFFDMVYKTHEAEMKRITSYKKWMEGNAKYDIIMFAQTITEFYARKGIPVHILMDDGHQSKQLHIPNKFKNYWYYHYTNDGPNGPMVHDERPYLYKYCPWIQYDYCMARTPRVQSEKTLNFAFGMNWVQKTNSLKPRFDFITDFMIPMSEEKRDGYVLRVNNKGDYPELVGRFQDRISYNEYLNEVATAKMTVIAPSTHYEMFSLRRFIESTERDCLPFVSDISNWKAGACGDEELISIFREELLITGRTLRNKLVEFENDDARRMQILDAIRNTQIYKSWKDVSTYKESLSEMGLLRKTEVAI